ncbi:MAG: chorismate mutase [Firmicutes bacterium]|nr:chorismate mutase [Bacillota bacterium]
MDLNDYRKEIDAVDEQLLALFARRMEISAAIAANKKERGLPTYDPAREEAILKKRGAQAGELAPYAEELFRCLFAQSKALQNKKRQEEQ